MPFVREQSGGTPHVTQFSVEGGSGTTLGTNFIIGNEYIFTFLRSGTSSRVSIASGAEIISDVAVPFSNITCTTLAFKAISNTIIISSSSYQIVSALTVS